MKCFIHDKADAVGVCKVCGKGMCYECSGYTNHKGICPACKMSELKKQRIGFVFGTAICGTLAYILASIPFFLILMLIFAIAFFVGFIIVQNNISTIKNALHKGNNSIWIYR